jgi:DNA modification methylase
MANYQIHQGNNVDTLRQYEDCHFDAIITDPPYGIEFLGKDWDNNTGAVETWQECLRVLKPGGYLLAFSAARTYHHLASNIESTGFVIRDQLMWFYASGFPKAQDVGKAIDKRAGKLQTKTYLPDIPDNREVKNSSTGSPRCNMCHTSYGVIHKKCSRDDCIRPWEQTSPDNEWAGWKTALKPAHEPIVMARKPFKGSTIDNVLTHGVGALNIDATRIPFEGKDTRSGGADGLSRLEFGEREPIKYKDQKRMIRAGRDPRNRLKDLETQTTPADHNHEETPVYEANPQGRFPSNVMGEIEGYQKFFYCPKVSRRERHCGFEQDQVVSNKTMIEQMGGRVIENPDTQDGMDIWLPHCGHIKIHGLKNEYNEWLKTQNTIDTESAPQGERRCSLDSHERWHQGMEHKKGGKSDPLAPDGLPKRITDTPLGGKKGMNHLHQRKSVGNNHPTVKPVALMRYLIQLVTPPNSRVLDPFTGSGSTGMAACELGHTFVGCELDPNYVEIAEKRIEGWLKPNNTPNNRPNPQDLFEDTE